MYRRLSLPRKPADPRDGQPSVRARGGVEAVLLSMPEICEALEAIYALAMTVRLKPRAERLRGGNAGDARRARLELQ
jgi:hypothetical protein